jgi:hypothetical protein
MAAFAWELFDNEVSFPSCWPQAASVSACNSAFALRFYLHTYSASVEIRLTGL